MTKFIFFLVTILSLLSSSIFASENIKKRQDAMQTVRNSMKILGPMAMGQKDFDSSLAKNTLKDFLIAIKPYKTYFPKVPSEEQKTDASLDIWSNKEDFNKLINNFVSTVELASKNKWENTEQFKSDFTEIGSSCKSCHRKYRR